MAKSDNKVRKVAMFDRTIIFVSLLLLLISIVLISSASVQEAFNKTGDTYFYLKRQVAFTAVAVVWGILMTSIPSKTWFNIALPLMGVAMALLVLVLIVGKEVNDAKRWIGIGPINLQPAELLKLFWIIYFSSYTCRKIEMVRHLLSGFIKPLCFIGFIAGLLLMQPDFGSLVVVTAITFGILFVAGAGLLKYVSTLSLVALAGAIIIWVQPYRLARITAFLDPWQDRFSNRLSVNSIIDGFR